jgi:hypothetical protein
MRHRLIAKAPDGFRPRAAEYLYQGEDETVSGKVCTTCWSESAKSL